MILAVLDVNVVVSAVLGALGFPRQVVEALRTGRFVAATSAGIIAEVETKLRLPRISRRYHLTDEDVAWAVDLLSSFTEIVVVPGDSDGRVRVPGVLGLRVLYLARRHRRREPAARLLDGVHPGVAGGRLRLHRDQTVYGYTEHLGSE